MARQRGRVELAEVILFSLNQQSLYLTQLRKKVGMTGSTLGFHLKELKQQKLIDDFFVYYNPVTDYHYYKITEKGKEALKYLQLTFDILGLPDLREQKK